MRTGHDVLSRESELADLLADARSLPDTWTPGDAQAVHSTLQKHAELADLRVAFAGNFTLEPLPCYTALECARQGIVLATHNLGFDQYFLDLLQKGGELAQFMPDAAVLMLTLRQLAPRVFYEFGNLTDQQLAAEQAAISEHLEQWLDVCSQRLSAVPVVAGFPSPRARHFGLADASLERSQADYIQDINRELRQQLRQRGSAVFLDVDETVARVGYERAYDERLYYLARMVYSDSAMRCLADMLTRTLYALAGRTKKCLVVDLDNTLWAGIVGEEGPQGIEAGVGDPEGEAYRDLQYGIRALKDRGVILAICSKNNPADVREAFAENPDMPLQLSDFAASRINWGPKPDNLREIALELNIGLDSMVFLDDNERECEAVRSLLPEVEVVHLDGDPAHYADRVQQLIYFERIQLTAEDLLKTQQYHQNASRGRMRQKSTSLEDFLNQLGTQATIRAPEQGELGRVEQLFQKTNQFNLTTVRYGSAQVQQIARDPEYALRIMEARDRCGDLGIIGLFLLRSEADVLHIDSLLMSCRAIGRELETVMMNAIKRLAIAQGAQRIVAEYRPTPRNQQVKRLYEEQGFALLSEPESGVRYYGLDTAAAVPRPCQHIKVIME